MRNSDGETTNPYESPSAADFETGLGKMLFEKRPNIMVMAVPAVSAVFLLFVGIVVLIGDVSDEQERNENFPLGLVSCISAVALSVVAVVQWKSVLRIHEYGLSKVIPFRQKDVYFTQLDSLWFSKTRRYANGIGGGARYSLRFGYGSKSIYIDITLGKDTDRQLEDVRDYVSKIIAESLSKRLDTEGHAPWTARLRFVRDGVEYFQEPEWHLVPFSSVGKCEIYRGQFYLRERGSEFPLIQENTMLPSFYPGLVLFVDRSSCEVSPDS